MDDKTKGQEKYLLGLELAKKGLTPDEIAKELGLFNARAWSTMKAYHGRKGLAELAAPTTANNPEPAAILEGVDCQRSEPRQKASNPDHKHSFGHTHSLHGELELPKWSNTHVTPGKASGTISAAEELTPRMTVRRVLAADGELVRYRVEGDLLQINAKGQKRAALEMGVNDARRMMEELNDFLEQVGV